MLALVEKQTARRDETYEDGREDLDADGRAVRASCGYVPAPPSRRRTNRIGRVEVTNNAREWVGQER